MSSRSIVNELFIQDMREINFSSTEQKDRTYELADFENGNIFFWAPITYTGGTNTLSFAESDDGNFFGSTPVPASRIIIPEVAIEAGLNPLEISAAGFQFGPGLVRSVEVRGVGKAFSHVVINGINGARILVGWICATERSPVTVNQIP